MKEVEKCDDYFYLIFIEFKSKRGRIKHDLFVGCVKGGMIIPKGMILYIIRHDRDSARARSSDGTTFPCITLKALEPIY